MQQFQGWFEELQAAERPDWFELNAMTLATSDSSGHVAARIVLLKKCTETGFVFFTNYESAKGRQLAENPRAALVFYWPHMERQIRVEGVVSKTDGQTNDTYFHSRPRSSQIGAIVSPQSSRIERREVLEEEVSKLEQKYAEQEIPRPEYWGGYELTAETVEFWQGRPSRLHDRCVYTKCDQGWQIDRLAP